MNKKHFGICMVFMVVVLVVITNVISANNLDKKFIVSREGQEIAKLTISTDKRFTKVIVERQGQAAHIYTKSLVTGDVTVDVSDKEVFSYNNKSGDFKTPNLDTLSEKTAGNVKQLKWTELKYSEMSIATQTLLTEDMKVFRAVRNFDDSTQTRSFELAYVILTADESIYWMNDFSDYKITSSSPATKSKEAFKQISFVGGAGCGEGCDSRLSACIRDVPAGDRIECYRIADTCHGRCDQAQPEEPPVS